jgi:transcriptional regulator with PAS, ATPase and Fis domain
MIIEQLKPILRTLSVPVALIDRQCNLLWGGGFPRFDLPKNLESMIDAPLCAGGCASERDGVVSVADRRLRGVLAPVGEFFVLICPEASPNRKNIADLAANKGRADADDIDIVYSSGAMKKTVEFAERAAGTDATVLLGGETGVGKTFLAKYIHSKSPRNSAPFVAINCGAIPISLIESELFGYERGAFTGAERTGKIGFFETAIGGTVFLDEIGEISKDIQVKILHTIEEKRVVRVGGREQIPLDIRLIVATNKDLARMVKDGDFREDLYYRLNVISLTIPPLRQRKDDILELARYYLRANNRKYNLNKEFTPAVWDIMLTYSWPGNVRELQNFVERMIVMSAGNTITEGDIPANIISFVNDETFHGANPERGSLQNEKDVLERELIERALSECTSIRKAAAQLGISHVTLLRKIKRLNMRSAVKKVREAGKQ